LSSHFLNFNFNFIMLGDPVLLREMILSIPLHMQNIHVFPNNTKFKQCSHLQLPTGRDKKWLEPGSLVTIFNCLSK
jgi:hypothetical protein